ncbi:helix-turn-helix domain-containing protein [Pseudalgibacter alginicilyticus]|uniref:helix-turn-helix domain-containing protein n=1 Tax=Pseudalgibacter alginicilyticus TaxID=1736674 RepID=UPI0012FDCC8F|nr:helix-turn-helix domain-containing protein [Pseudalgibacter alginicilyticus]
MIEKRHFQLIKNWTLFLFIISVLLFIRILYSISLEKISDRLFQGKSYSSLTLIPWLFIYGKILISPEILYGYPKLKKRVAYLQNQVTLNDHIWVFDSINISNLQDKKLSSTIEERILPYISDIENYVNKEHPFRDSKLTFSDFAKTINIPASHLNYIFKYHSVVTYVEYRNYCRIKDALKYIDHGTLSTLTLEGLANKVGFSSYNSFFTAFKKQTDLAPKEYLTQQNKLVLKN